MQHDQTVGRKNDKIQPDLESKMAPMLKKEKKAIQSTLSQEWPGMFG